MKVLWDVTGYEVAKASWSKPKTKEEYFKTLAVFWSMNAPVMLPSLPGIGSEPVKIGQITQMLVKIYGILRWQIQNMHMHGGCCLRMNFRQLLQRYKIGLKEKPPQG